LISARSASRCESLNLTDHIAQGLLARVKKELADRT
jgi:hypothetical protein